MPGDVDWTPLCDTMANLTDLPIFTDQGNKECRGGGEGVKRGRYIKLLLLSKITVPPFLI